MKKLDHRKLYRLPWSLTDNVISWLEPTKECNLPDGSQSMCDSCPDITVHDGQLVWSCRLEERLKYGELMRMRPARADARKAEETAT